MNVVTLTAFDDELEKIATSSAAAVGAGLGAGLQTLRSGLKEWDRRSHEAKKPQTPEMKADRRHRAKRIGVNVGLSAAAGGLAAHGGEKLYNKALHSAGESAKNVSNHFVEGANRTADRLGGHFQAPFKGENAKDLGKNLGEGLSSKAEGLGANLRKGFTGAETVKSKAKAVGAKAKKVGARATGFGKELLEKAKAKGPKFVKNLMSKLGPK